MNLPYEIYLQIFKLLDKPTISNCAIVCKDWTVPAFQVYYKEIAINEHGDALKASLYQEPCFKYCLWTEKVYIRQDRYGYHQGARKPEDPLTEQAFLKFFEYFPNLKIIEIIESDYTKCLRDIDSSQYLTRLEQIIFKERSYSEWDDLYCTIYYNFRASLAHISLHHARKSALESQYGGILSYLRQFKKLTHLAYYNSSSYYVTVYKVQVACPSLTSIKMYDYRMIPPAFQDDSNVFYQHSHLKELSVTFANVTSNYIEYIAKCLPKSVESLDISINDIDFYDWIDQVGIDNALKLAQVMSKLFSASLEWVPDKEYETKHENSGESDMTIFFKMLNVFKGDKKVSCTASFSDFRSIHNSISFFGEDLRIHYGLNYVDLFDDSEGKLVLEMVVPDRTISVIGPEVINSLMFFMCVTDPDLAFKILKYSLTNCPHLQSLEINGVNTPRQECILSSSIDRFRKRVEKYDPVTISAEALKAVNLKGFLPSQECFDLLSCYLPGILGFTCKSERGNRFDNSEVPQDYVVDLTQFKSLQEFYFDIGLVSTSLTRLVKFEFTDGETSYYQFREKKDTMFESISLEDIQNNQTFFISLITFRCEKIEKFAFYSSEKCNIFEFLRGLPQKERLLSYDNEKNFVDLIY
ncbi:hypothetical protein HPULCUR_005383 [Helicostylum pulchrum]|uniref:F-box domain-containing protein n=1 Tax=Helicostylum pulchrum TaxID=562976 RepID=A0ABP9XYY4_9FUNG